MCRCRGVFASRGSTCPTRGLSGSPDEWSVHALDSPATEDRKTRQHDYQQKRGVTVSCIFSRTFLCDSSSGLTLSLGSEYNFSAYHPGEGRRGPAPQTCRDERSEPADRKRRDWRRPAPPTPVIGVRTPEDSLDLPGPLTDLGTSPVRTGVHRNTTGLGKG